MLEMEGSVVKAGHLVEGVGDAAGAVAVIGAGDGCIT
jgi:hypothetical protein